MRDPDLIVRAERAAVELERAWDRWRTMHGLGTDPLPPVSSYVGYSLHEPWGQPRVVFGIDAGEAEQLAALLDRHDCAGPVYASVASLAGARVGDSALAGDAAEARTADPDRHSGAGRLHVPSQAQPGAAQRERLAEPAPADALGPLEREPGDTRLPLDLPAPPDRGPHDEPQRGAGPAGPRGEESAAEPQAARAADDLDETQLGPPAFRPRPEPADYSGEDEEADLDEPGPAAESDPAAVGWTRASRMPRGRSLPRQKRGGGPGKGSKQVG